MDVEGLFEELRNNENCHLGLGDIRLTLGSQREIVSHIQSLENKLKELREVLQEATLDLEQEIDYNYRDSSGNLHPAYERKYNRDMSVVKRARGLLECQN